MAQTVPLGRRRSVALGAALSLLALFILAGVPHPWHKDGGSRACAICQAYRTPTQTPSPPLSIEPSPVRGPEPAQRPLPDERRPALVARLSRAPPF